MKLTPTEAYHLMVEDEDEFIRLLIEGEIDISEKYIKRKRRIKWRWFIPYIHETVVAEDDKYCIEIGTGVRK